MFKIDIENKMFKFLDKYKFQFNILAAIIFGTGSVFNFIDYNEKGDGMDLFGGIIFGIAAIFRIVDIIESLKVRRKAE